MVWDDLLGALPVGQLGFGGMAGVVVGYTAKKLAKLLALFLGVLFILLQVLAYYGFITINWGTVQQEAGHVWTNSQGVTLLDRMWEVISANLPFGGAFVAGFALGFKLG